METPRFVQIIGGVSVPGYKELTAICGLTAEGEVYVFKSVNTDFRGQWIKLENPS